MDIFIKHVQEVRNLGLVLMQAIFKGLEMDCSQIVDTQDLLEYCFSIKEDTSFGRLNYYPEYVSNGNNSNQLGVGPHSDAGVLTVLYQQEGVCSLQVLKDNTFYDIPPIKGVKSRPCHVIFLNNSKNSKASPSIFYRFIRHQYWRYDSSLVQRKIQGSNSSRLDKCEQD